MPLRYQVLTIEKLRLDFCKHVLGVKRSTCDVAVYSELGRFPLLYQKLISGNKYCFIIIILFNLSIFSILHFITVSKNIMQKPGCLMLKIFMQSGYV